MKITLANKKIKRHAYTLLKDEDYAELDVLLKCAGIESRTEFFTACSLIVLNGENPFEYCLSLSDNIERKKKIQTVVTNLLDADYFPVVAMNGVHILLKNDDLFDEIKKEIISHCGTLPEDEEIVSLLKNYSAIRKEKMAQYRRDRFCAEQTLYTANPAETRHIPSNPEATAP